MDVTPHLRWAQNVAVGAWRRSPRLIDLEDAKAIGALALVEAAARFQSARGVPFEGYAYPRIAGAVRDAVRAHAPRVRRAPHIRARLGVPVTYRQLPLDDLSDEPADDAAPLWRSARYDLTLLLRRTSSLSPRDRAVIRALLAGATQDAIARRLNQTPSGVCLRVQRITRALRATALRTQPTRSH